MALSSSKGLNISMVSDAAQATQTRLLITTLVSLLPPLFIVHKLFCFILLLFHRHLPTTYLVTVVVLIYGMWLWTGPLWCLSLPGPPCTVAGWDPFHSAGSTWLQAKVQDFNTNFFGTLRLVCSLQCQKFLKTNEVLVLVTSLLL